MGNASATHVDKSPLACVGLTSSFSQNCARLVQDILGALALIEAHRMRAPRACLQAASSALLATSPSFSCSILCAVCLKCDFNLLSNASRVCDSKLCKTCARYFGRLGPHTSSSNACSACVPAGGVECFAGDIAKLFVQHLVCCLLKVRL